MRTPPVDPGDHPTPSNLSTPDREKPRASASWSSPNTLMVHAPVGSINGQLVDAAPGAKATSGGDSESEKNDWQVKPAGPPLAWAATTTTPLAK